MSPPAIHANPAPAAPPAPRTAATTRRELSPQRFALCMSLPVIVFMLALMAYPLLFAAWLSLQEVSLLGGLQAEFVGLRNYREALQLPEFWWSTAVTLRFTAESVLLTLALGLGLALVLHRARRGAALWRTLVVLPWSVSMYAAAVAWSYLARGQTGVATSLVNKVLGHDSAAQAVELSLINARWVVELLALGNAWNLAPLLAFFLLANLQTIPARLYDLAALDQLTPWQRFIHVTLPPLRYTLFVFASIATVLSMKLLDFIYVMTAGGPGDASTTLTFQLYDLAFRQTNLGLSAAMSFYLLALIIGATLLLYLAWGRREGAQ